jgi:hypothetical protein
MSDHDPTHEPTTDETGTPMDSTDTTYDSSSDLAPAGSPAGSPAGTDPASGRHPVNIGHLVMGLAFAGLVVIWALIEGDVIADSDIRWLLPIPWVLAGTAGLLAVTLGNRRPRNP